MLGRLVAFAAVGGVLAAAMVVPIVAASGVLVRNEADKFTTLSMNDQSLPQRSEIFDRDGHLLAYVYGVDVPYYSTASNASVLQYFGYDRDPVSFGQISTPMVNALVAIEDSRYWEHGAIDLRGTIRAAVNDIQHQPVQGGSTIAQQYVKNVLLLEAQVAQNSQAVKNAAADNLNRKLNELRMAVAAEHQESKQDILDGYLNDAYFGNQAYGIEVAAETYFNTTAQKLTVTQAATLAGIVENPSRYDPLTNPTQALKRRNTVLGRMWQTDNGLTEAQATIDEAKPLGVSKNSVPQSGCESSSVGTAGFFCQYVEEVFLHDAAYGKTPMDRAKLLSNGGLKIYTTLNPKDQSAANYAVNYVEPGHSDYWNPGHNADTEAMVQPGTGQIEAIAENQPYGTLKGQTEIDYAVNTAYGGSSGVQTGSSSKLFTLITALNQGVPFGFQLTVPGTTTVTGYTDCQGAPAGYYQGAPGAFNVTNSEGTGKSTDSLYTGTTNSINVFYAELEKKVGLCNVVHTAVSMGMTRADGTSLLSPDNGQDSADNIPSFTLGSVNVAPLSMAAAYATVASRGMYCSPVAISSVVTSSGNKLAVPSASCHRALSSDVADAVNYILQGVLTTGTADLIGGLSGREAAGKTGTSNVAGNNGTPYAAFAGYTPTLVGYVSVFNPYSPTVHDTMANQTACYRLESGSLDCPPEMYGANAPGSTWHTSFDHASLGPVEDFVSVATDSPFNSMGNGQVVIQPKTPKKGGGKGGGGGGNGGGNGGGGGGGNGGGGGGKGGNPVNAALRRTGRV